MDGIKLSFKDTALDFIVDKAIEFKLGARGLRSICEAIMVDAMFELPSSGSKDEVVITKKYAMEKLEKQINNLMLLRVTLFIDCHSFYLAYYIELRNTPLPNYQLSKSLCVVWLVRRVGQTPYFTGKKMLTICFKRVCISPG